MKNTQFRLVAMTVLRDRGFDVHVSPGQGYLPGSRLVARRGRKEIVVAVKASQQRAISFTRQSDGRWRTLSAVDLVLAVVPDEHSADEADVLAFDRKALVRIFNRAWKALESAKRSTGFNMPIFIPIDAVSAKNVGHEVGNLKKLADWSVHLTERELDERTSIIDESYVDEFRRRFAADNSVDFGQVVISISGKSK